MKNILHIFKSDLKHMTGSVVCLILVIGLSIIPCLYGWINIMATMDPYSEEAMSKLKIAVASDDEGAELYGIKLNMGDELRDSLKANRSLGWVFTDTSEEAEEGVKSGEYYAAIVVPETFTEDIIAFRQGEYRHPKLIFYENAKENVIAAKITELAKDTVRDQLNSAFSSKLVGAVMTAINVGSAAGMDYGKAYDELIKRLGNLSKDMDSIMKTTGGMKALTGSADKMIKSTQGFMPEADSLIKDSSAELKSVWKRLENGQADYADLRDSSVILLQQTIDTLDTVDSWINAEINAAEELTDDSAAAVKDLNKTLSELSGLMDDSIDYILKTAPDSKELNNMYNHASQAIDNAQTLLTQLLKWRAADAERKAQGDSILSGDEASRTEYQKEHDKAVQQTKDVEAASADLKKDLKDISKSLASARDDLKRMQKELKNLDTSKTAALGAAYSDLQSLSKDLVKMEGSINDDIADTRDSLTELIDNLNGEQKLDMMIDLTQKDINSVAAILDSTDGVYGSSMAALSAYAKTLSTIDGDIDETRNVIGKLQAGTQSLILNIMDFESDGTLDHLIKIADSDTETITDFLAEPVKLNTVAVYEIDNYGSANAPFYTLLSLWVGAIFTLALFRTRVADKDKPENLNSAQEFAGRFLLLFVLGEIQAVIASLGVCFYIGIDCVSPFLFILGCMVSSFIFMLIVYSLTYALGTTGLGIGVVFILLQVAGSGGSFPVEVLPVLYQKLYPIMPFKQALAMMREAVGGMYGNTYWISMLKLMIFGVIAVPFGIIVRKLYEPLYQRMEKAKEKTGVML